MISGHSLERVVLAHPVLEVIGPVLGDQTAVIHLDRYSRRRYAHLRGVVEAQSLAPLDRRLAAGHDLCDEAVELRSRDALRAPVGQLDRRGEELLYVAAVQGRGRDHRRALPDPLRDSRLDLLEVHGHLVPLVEGEDRGAPGLHRQVGDPQVLGGEPLGRVHDHDRDVRTLRGALRADLRVELDGARDPRALAKAGGVHQEHGPVAHLKLGVDRVARGARDVGDDDPVRTPETG